MGGDFGSDCLVRPEGINAQEIQRAIPVVTVQCRWGFDSIVNPYPLAPVRFGVSARLDRPAQLRKSQLPRAVALNSYLFVLRLFPCAVSLGAPIPLRAP